ncbi:MAG: hypothetical protein NTZ90_05340 [Proteobacteria bacterium]|nr:hypothetical protein [Pseudomonadota bacterium]
MSSKYALNEIKQLVEARLKGDETIWFSARSASIDYVIKVLVVTELEAESIILNGILKLDDNDFHRRVLMVNWANEIADEYGLEGYHGHNWYIKLLVEDEANGRVVNEISFHPTEDEMRLANGRMLQVTMNEQQVPMRPAKGRRGK